MSRLFTDSDTDRIVKYAYRLLTEVGLKVDHAEVEQKMIAAGCQPGADGRLRIPLALVDELVESHRKLQHQQEAAATEVSPGTEGLMGCVFNYGPSVYYDYERRRQLPADTAIMTQMFQFADATPEIARVHTWPRQDTRQEIEAIESVVLGLKITRKVRGVDAMVPAQVKYLLEIGEVVAGQPGVMDSYLAGSQCMTPPLILGHRSAEEMLERTRRGVQNLAVPTMLVVGVNTPATLAGAVVMGVAETLAGMVAAYVINPEAICGGTACTMSMDMATGSTLLASPEVALFNAGIVEVFQRRLGGQCNQVIQYSPNSPVPGLQAVYENFMMAFGMRLIGQEIKYVGTGLLANAGVGSPVQAMLDIEVMKSLAYLDAPMPITDETVPFEEIMARVSSGEDFLTSEHTLTHFRDLWSPRMLLRRVTDLLGSTEQAILERCNEAWQENLAHYQPPDWPDGILHALDDIVRRARAELCS